MSSVKLRPYQEACRDAVLTPIFHSFEQKSSEAF